MYQKFLLEVFYPSNLLEIFFVRDSARSRALMIYLPLIRKSARGHRCCYALSLDNWHHSKFGGLSTRYGSMAVYRTIHEIHVYAKGKVSLNILNILSTIMHACYF